MNNWEEEAMEDRNNISPMLKQAIDKIPKLQENELHDIEEEEMIIL
jgi:hypothetical protein